VLNNDDADGTPYDDPGSWTSYVKNDVMDYYSYGEWSKILLKLTIGKIAYSKKDTTVKLIYKLEVVMIKLSSLALCSI